MTNPIQRVLVEDTASPSEVAAVQEAFGRAGLDVEVDAGYGRRSADLLPWIVSVTLATPIAAFFAAFGAKFGSKTAEDAYVAVRAWVKDVWNARRGSGTGDGSLAIDDPEGSNLILSTRIPDEALDALAAIDWNERRGHYLVWDEARREWRDPTRSSG